ncbi:hypothetical protein [Allochromatium palmeri]|uniref:Uncharacterized protein n=1 Tax=Allochromatium palmeri TaxID=231048 RepID=A0A6N8EDS3_9GAMM|nr:hypothetical protein [Allochromatium palmeri]MTW22402.1 hypothetical protein [Allochromatium palmeri]
MRSHCEEQQAAAKTFPLAMASEGERVRLWARREPVPVKLATQGLPS